MPTYEYKCAHCGDVFEAFQKITDKHLDKCPKCGRPVKRLISSGSGIIFKGSGFYATDYRKKAKAGPPKSCPKNQEGCNACHQE